MTVRVAARTAFELDASSSARPDRSQHDGDSKPFYRRRGTFAEHRCVDLQHHLGQEGRLVAGQKERRLTDVMGRRMAPIMRADPKGREMSNDRHDRCSVMSTRYTIPGPNSRRWR
jgi:hypothetical protein